MCGRVKLPEDHSEIRLVWRPDIDKIQSWTPRYNVAPTTMVPVLTSANGTRTAEMMRWGLIPSWAKEEKLPFATFNARADGVKTKPAFRGAWKAGRRCLIAASGFYEWRKPDKQPFMIALGNRQLMSFAGLWEEWRPKDRDPVRSCTIITTDANSMIAPLHDRMPVILGPEDWPAWLGEEPIADPATLLRPFPPEQIGRAHV